MALMTSPGATAVYLGVAGTKRDDISEALLASMAQSNNLIGALGVGAPFNDNIAKWVEDSLNPTTIKDTTGGGQNNSDTTSNLTVSASDAGLLRIGFVLADTSATYGGLGGGEQVQVTAITGTTVQVTRGYSSTTKTAHAQDAVWSIVADPDIEVSGLNNDMSRTRVPKYNYLTRHTRDVIVSNEAMIRANRGYTPGVPNEFKYQLEQRLAEMTQISSKTILYSRPSPGRNGSAGNSGGDYSTLCGLYAFLDGSQNGGLTTGTATINWATNGYGVGQVDLPTSLANKTIAASGGQPDWVVCGAAGAQDFGRLYKDQIRLNTNDLTRGWAANVFRTLLGNELDVMLDFHVEDTSGIGQLFILDSSRVRVLPKVDEFASMITAPTLLDAGVCRVLSKFSLGVRNTGTDAGQAHYLVTNANFNQT